MLVIADQTGTVLDIYEPPAGFEWWPEDDTDDYVRVVEANLPDGTTVDDVQVVRTDDRSLAKHHLTVEDGEIVVGDERTPPADTSPDVDGLLLAAHAPTDQGGIGKQAARALARDYPDLTTALTRSNWGVARAAVDDAHADGALTDSQRQTIVDLMSAYHIPES